MNAFNVCHITNKRMASSFRYQMLPSEFAKHVTLLRKFNAEYLLSLLPVLHVMSLAASHFQCGAKGFNVLEQTFEIWHGWRKICAHMKKILKNVFRKKVLGENFVNLSEIWEIIWKNLYIFSSLYKSIQSLILP